MKDSSCLDDFGDGPMEYDECHNWPEEVFKQEMVFDFRTKIPLASGCYWNKVPLIEEAFV